MSRRSTREFDIRTWSFRKSYPTGIKQTDELVLVCSKCERVYKRPNLPITLADGELDHCNAYHQGNRCMNREYQIYAKLELEAMPIGKVVLPSGRQGTWTSRGK